MDEDGYVAVSQEPGMGYKFKWEYIEQNRIVD